MESKSGAYVISVANAGAQNDCVQTLKTNRIAVIQIASGLCVKTSLSEEKLKELIGLPVKSVSASDPELSEDARKFIESLPDDARTSVEASK